MSWSTPNQTPTQPQFGLFGPALEVPEPEDGSMFNCSFQEESKYAESDPYYAQSMVPQWEYETVLNFKLEVCEPMENDKKRKIPFDNHYSSTSEQVEYESKAEEPVVHSPHVHEDRSAAKARRATLKERSKSFDETSQVKKTNSGRRNKRPRSNSESEIRARAPLWTDQEEIFLVGAVMKRFFKYGSLASSRKTENDVWVSIKDSFDQMVKEHGQANQAVRTKNALSRHFKFMKSTQDPRRPKFYELYKKYEERYGKGGMFEGLDV